MPGVLPGVTWRYLGLTWVLPGYNFRVPVHCFSFPGLEQIEGKITAFSFWQQTRTRSRPEMRGVAILVACESVGTHRYAQTPATLSVPSHKLCGSPGHDRALVSGFSIAYDGSLDLTAIGAAVAGTPRPQ